LVWAKIFNQPDSLNKLPRPNAVAYFVLQFFDKEITFCNTDINDSML
jgi:hypothetical protein